MNLETYPCKGCGVSIKPIVFGDRIVRPPLCDVCSDKAEAQRLERIAQDQSTQKLRSILSRREMMRLMRLSKTPLLDPLQNLVDELTTTQTPWVMLHGVTGTGKTTMLQLFIKRLMEHHFKQLPDVIYTTELDMMTDLKTFEHNYSHYAHAGVLIVDELGLLKGTDFEFQQWLGIINHRYRHGMVTLFGSNLTPSQFVQHQSFGERTYTRLLEMAGPNGIVEMTGDFDGGGK